MSFDAVQCGFLITACWHRKVRRFFPVSTTKVISSKRMVAKRNISMRLG